MEKEIEQLEKIEKQNSTFNSSFAKKIAIWEDIADEICASDGKENDFWCRVMDLYKEKYKE
jgi:hypothetical protein